MVGFTSALGRALGYMGIGIEGGLASANEVEARQTGPRGPVTPDRTRSATDGPTDAQKRMLKALAYVGEIPATKRDTSQLIDRLKAAAMGTEEAF